MNTRATCLALTFAAACGDEGGDEDLPDWSDGYEDGGSDSGDDTAVPEGTMAVSLPSDLGYETRIHLDEGEGPCAITVDGTMAGYEAISCTIETAELDLHAYGLNYDLTVPSGACEYVEYWHYMYEAWEVGTGPEEVSYDIDEDGDIVNEVNSVFGAPYCEYDYSWADDTAPNCCLGTYVTTVHWLDDDTTETYPPQSWGGKPSDCYGGAAFHDAEAAFSEDGWPMAKIVFLGQDSWQKRFSFPSLAAEYYTNVPLANWYDPDDHDDTMPAGLTGEWAAPTYEIVCFDHARENLGQISLTVREWNLESEFENDGDPDSEGTEPISGEPIDDYRDWAIATPGSDTWIEAYE